MHPASTEKARYKTRIQMSKNIDDWLNAYNVCHQHPQNKLIHYICVPAIAWSALALLWLVAIPYTPLTGAHVLLGFSFGFYLHLSLRLTLAMILPAVLMMGSIVAHQQFLPIPLWVSATGVFIVAWIFQFIGHHIEGKKPSFFEDLQYLLIGPLWIVAFVFKKWNVPYQDAK